MKAALASKPPSMHDYRSSIITFYGEFGIDTLDAQCTSMSNNLAFEI